MYGQIDPRLLRRWGQLVGRLSGLIWVMTGTSSSAFDGRRGVGFVSACSSPWSRSFPARNEGKFYVKNVVDRLRPQYEQAARFHWDQLQKAITTDPKVGGRLSPSKPNLPDGQYQPETARSQWSGRKPITEQSSPEVRKDCSERANVRCRKGVRCCESVGRPRNRL